MKVIPHRRHWLKRLLDLIERPSQKRLQRTLRRNAEWCREAQEAPPLWTVGRRPAY